MQRKPKMAIFQVFFLLENRFKYFFLEQSKDDVY